ncbi:MAG: hypothetical protein LBL90_00560 [Prevotellaceae bacterium]|jgi:hypothetical protein|nr:hypothetical protein [Prevotellaceae bacterium]
MQAERNFTKNVFTTVEEPFIIIKKSRDNDEYGLLYYSEKKRFDKKAIEDLKTVVLAKNASRAKVYNYGRNGMIKVRVYDVEITYIDLINKKYDKITIENSPPESTRTSRDHTINENEIIRKVISKSEKYKKGK